MGIDIKFINKSNDTNNSSIVIFQKNIAQNSDLHQLAWHVIKFNQNDSPIVTLHPQVMISGSTFKNPQMTNIETSPMMNVNEGDLFAMTQDTSGNVLRRVGHTSSSGAIQLRNDLPVDTSRIENGNPGGEKIVAGIHKVISDSYGYFGAGLLASSLVTPSHTATFDFEPKIYIGICGQLENGQTIKDNELSCVTEIPLDGLCSADVIITGGSSDGINLEVTNVTR